MTLRKLFFISLFTIHCSLFIKPCFAQDQKVVDSLKMELIKYDAHKLELGSHATPLMDSIRVNIMYRILVESWYNKPDTVLLLAEKILTLSEQIGYKKGIGSGYNGMGLCYMAKQDYENALKNFQKALKVRSEINDKDGVGWTYNNLGLMYGNQSKYSESVKYHLKAIAIRDELGERLDVAASFGKMGHLYLGLGNFPEALKYYFKALKIGEELANNNQIAVSCGDIGQIYSIQGNFNEALKYHQRLLKIGKETGNKYLLAASYAYMGDLSEKLGNYEEGIKNQLAALKLNREHGDSGSCAYFNYSLALFYLAINKYPEALQYFYASLTEYEYLNIKSGIGLIHIKIGEVYAKQGNLQKGLEHELKGLPLAQEVGAKDAIKSGYKNLSDIYLGMKDYKAAYQNHVLYQQMKDSLFNDETAGKMKAMQMQYDFDKDEALQKAEQDKKDILAAKEVEKIKFRRNTIFLVMVIIVAFLIIVIILRNRIANERRQKSIAQERSRISRDLHDDLGSGLISIFMMSEQIQNPDNKELITGNVEKIKQSSKLMIDQMRIIIWAMNSLNDTLENLIIYMESYSKDYFDNLPIKFSIDILENIPKNEMSGMVRRNIFLVVKESLNNINRHSKATEVNISVSGNREGMKIVISDNGIGFDVEETRRFGNGLKNMNNRMNDLNGKFSVESILGKGTKTFINFPLA